MSEPERAVKQLRRGIEGKSVNSRYVVNFLDVFREKSKKLKTKIKSEKNTAFRKQLKKELRALQKAIASVEQVTEATNASGDSPVAAEGS